MILNIGRLRNFGIFGDYTKPVDMRDFTERNIIYGWNYSGKTTISRIFQSLEHRALPKGFESASLSINTTEQGEINESNLSICPIEVRVFNTDFVDSNLQWDGVFDPILLLGDESISAQEQIDRNNNLIERVRISIGKKDRKLNDIDQALRRSRTDTAAHIKRTLALVGAYTAAHLNQRLPTVRRDPSKYVLSDSEYAAYLKRALASVSDKLEEKASIALTPLFGDISKRIPRILSTAPALTNTIESLASNGELADWVRRGLDLHEGKTSCEFCGNLFSEKRRGELASHFSEDLKIHENEIDSAQDAIDTGLLKFVPYHQKDYYPVSREGAKLATAKLTSAIKRYNDSLKKLKGALESKRKSPFSTVELPEFGDDVDQDVTMALEEINQIIEVDNATSAAFEDEKQTATNKVRDHLIGEYCLTEQLDAKDRLISVVERNKTDLQGILKRLAKENEDLEATISNAQKGKDELNSYVARFLTGSDIEIAVVKDEGLERFSIVRNGVRARHLSEGEKTAIAFAFFLTKLKEDGDLSNVVVFIDDPISSLDSNHLFQVNAVIGEYFFRKDDASEPKWSLTVKQIFFSTHNFEFLKLLKELPVDGKKRSAMFYTKRVDLNAATLIDIPSSIERYSSEYQYLWDVIHTFHASANKQEISTLLGLPNVVRRFVELYTYSKYPSAATVNARAEVVFGAEHSKRLLKILHYFSHSNNIQGLAQNSDLLCDIEDVVAELVARVEQDELHHKALMDAIA